MKPTARALNARAPCTNGPGLPTGAEWVSLKRRAGLTKGP